MGRLTGWYQVATCGVLELLILPVMKYLVALCILAIGARAQVGPSGIVNPDGTLVQFTREQADNIAVIGPSGIVTKDGTNMQLRSGQDSFTAADIPTPVAKPKAPLPTSPLLAGLVGPSGIVNEKGNTQFTREFADNIAVAGPSGVVTKDGRNIQFRTKRSYDHLVGASGIVTGKGEVFQLPAGVTVASDGPSGAVLSNGENIQFRSKRSASYDHLVGASGIVTGKGEVFQLPAGVTVASAGPSGAVLSNGENIQLRAKRSASYL